MLEPPHRTPYTGDVALRLLLALLIAAFSLPAMAAMPCHDGAAPMRDAMAMPREQHRTPPATSTQHQCIGCIAPTSLRIAALTAPPARPALPLRAEPIAPLDAHAISPATPPPRFV